MTPTTLPALRTAVARVLVARGESAEALACDARRAARGYPRGAPWYARIAAPWESLGAPAAWASDTWGATEADAIALAWGRLVADAAARVVDCEGARDAAEARLRRARAACEAAGVGDG